MAITFDPDCPATWERYSETTPDGGRIVLVRYPEGYRLRYHGLTVWKEEQAVSGVGVEPGATIYCGTWGKATEA